ncbi:MAG TPA: glycosyltransferase family 1 protein [bacterium]|nr:glycosyltransferase family 1 protein [bacterium]
MRLGIDGREFLRGSMTGIGRYLKDFILWTADNRPDIKPVIFLNQDCEAQFADERIETVRIDERNTRYWDQVQLPAALRKNGIDVLFSPYVKMPIVSPCPVVMVLNDLIPLRPGGDRREPLLNRVYFRSMARLALGRAAVTVAISNFTREEAVAEFGRRARDIRVVHLGISNRFFEKSDDAGKEKARGELGISEPYILYAGHLKKTKNVGALIEAYAGLPDDMIDKYLLVVAGRRKGEYERLVSLSERLGVNERVMFPGFIDDEHLPGLLGGAELFVYPSLNEGFGFPPVEAMACGVPVISSTTGSLSEIVSDAAYRVDDPNARNLATAIEKMLGDDGMRKEYRDRAAGHAASFTVERMADGFIRAVSDAAKC